MDWISVKDRLPELDELVLCYSRVKDIDGDFYNVISLGKRFVNYTQKPVFSADAGSFASIEEILFWLPLPEPPKHLKYPRDKENRG